MEIFQLIKLDYIHEMLLKYFNKLLNNLSFLDLDWQFDSKDPRLDFVSVETVET